MTAAPAGCLRTPAGRGIAPVAVRSKSGTQPLRERELSSRPAAQPASAGPPRRPWLDDDQGARHRGQRLPPDDTRASSTPLRTTCKKSHDLCDLAFQSVDIDHDPTPTTGQVDRVDHVVVGQVEQHARSLTPRARRLDHDSWSLSWQVSRRHPSQPKATSPSVTGPARHLHAQPRRARKVRVGRS